MTAPKWVRPDHPPTPHTTTRHNGRNWTAWALARQAITDAEHAGDPAYAARVLSEAAWELVRYDRLWTAVRPPLGVRRSVRDEAA